MDDISTNNPNYLQPPDYSAQLRRPDCKHENIVPSESNDKNIYPYRCANTECDAKFPEVCIEMADGNRPSIVGCYALRPFKVWKTPEDIHYDPASFGKALCPKGSNCEECWPKELL